MSSEERKELYCMLQTLRTSQEWNIGAIETLQRRVNLCAKEIERIEEALKTEDAPTELNAKRTDVPPYKRENEG